MSDLWHIVDQNSNQLVAGGGVASTAAGRRFVKFSECVENAKGEEGEPAAFDFGGEPALSSPG